MPDVKTELRAYLDQTVERVDVEDVLGRARARTSRRPHPFVHRRPAWIAAAAALIMLVSIGAVAAGAWLLRGEAIGEFVARPDGGTGPPGWSHVLILGLAIGGGTIALLTAGNALSNLIHRIKDRRDIMQTIETPDLELARLREDNARLGSTKRSLIATLVVVVIAVAAAAAWVIIDNAGTAVERDIAALIDDYYAAWSADDNQALLDLMTGDATLIANNGFTYTGEAIGPFATAISGFHPERIGETIILSPTVPETTGWFVAAHTVAPDYPGYGDIEELELFKIIEQDGTYLIDVHETWLAGE